MFLRVDSVNLFKVLVTFPVWQERVIFNTAVKHFTWKTSFISSGNVFKIALANFFSAFLKIAFCSASNFGLTTSMHSKIMNMPYASWVQLVMRLCKVAYVLTFRRENLQAFENIFGDKWFINIFGSMYCNTSILVFSNKSRKFLLQIFIVMFLCINNN